MGPYKISTKEGFRYFSTIVDDYTRSVWVYLLKGKDEIYDNVVSFYNLLHIQFQKNVNFFQSDNGTEFRNNRFGKFVNDNRIVHQTLFIYTPQQNGVVENKHRQLLNVARTLMFQGNIPLNMWHECILNATYLINRTPSFVLGGKCPYEYVYGFSAL